VSVGSDGKPVADGEGFEGVAIVDAEPSLTEELATSDWTLLEGPTAKSLEELELEGVGGRD
jgi:hypothetical protein